MKPFRFIYNKKKDDQKPKTTAGIRQKRFHTGGGGGLYPKE